MGQAEMDGHALLGSPRGGGAGQRKIGRTAFPAQHGQIAEGKAAQPGTCIFKILNKIDWQICREVRFESKILVL